MIENGVAEGEGVSEANGETRFDKLARYNKRCLNTVSQAGEIFQ